MTSRRFMSKKGIYKRLKNSFFLISQKMKLEVFNRFLFQTLRGDFLMEVAHFEMLWKWTLISDHSNHLPNFFLLHCNICDVSSFATQISKQIVPHIYQCQLFFNLGQSRPLFLSWPFSHHNSITNWKKRRCGAWDSNEGPQGGRHRRIHWAIYGDRLYFGNCFRVYLTRGK